MSTTATVISMIIAAIFGILVFKFGLFESPFIGFKAVGFSLRFDALSILMFSMIAVIGFIVVRYSHNYLDGDARQSAFIGRLSATIASVQLLVLSGNLGLLFISWVLTSLSLHRLLIFYKERPGAIIASRKKFIVARLANISLLIGSIFLYVQFGTGNLNVIFETINNNLSSGIPNNGIETAAVFIALAALFKSAQFPTHGWLIEVMETPTPVSALLHAGLLNAGPFLIVRMAYIMEASTTAPIILIIVGGFTALFASVVAMTQTSIKTTLGYSSIGHMGFSLLICGFGVYPAAMLHIVAHSFYKAHAFLSSGSTIDVIRAAKVKGSKRIGNSFRIVLGILLALVVYVSFAFIWGIDSQKELPLMAIGGIIVLGLSRLLTSAIDSTSTIKLMLRAGLRSLIVTTAFFTLETGFHHLLISQIPETIVPTVFETVLIIAVVIIFGATVLIQIWAPLISDKSFYRAMAIHLRNGLYANVLFNKLVKALYVNNRQTQSLILKNSELKNPKLAVIQKK